MPDPITVKVDYFFEDIGNSGWTETFYFTDTDITVARDRAETKYVTQRLSLLTGSYSLRELRVSDVAILRDSLVKSYTFAQGLGNYPAVAGARDEQPWDALLVRIEAGALNRRSLLMRGLPGGLVDPVGVYTPSALWSRRFAAFRASCLAAPPFQIRTQTSGPGFRADNINIGPGGWTISLNFLAGPPPSFVAGRIVRISGVKGAAFINGLWKIYQVIGNAVLMEQKRRPAVGNVLITGSAKLITIGFSNFTNLIPERGVKKSTGRPFDEPRGRRRVNQ